VREINVGAVMPGDPKLPEITAVIFPLAGSSCAEERFY
jgi:hypothetical protein